jgi:predicted phage-related endonuclease
MSSNILDVSATVAGAIHKYKDLATEIKNLQDRQKDIKNEIDAVLKLNGLETLATSTGKVSYVQPSVTVSYKASALDVLCRSSDEINRLLAPHRTETQKTGYLLIK